METGHHFMTNNSLNTTNIFKELSIQIAMNGLSFSIRNTTSKEIVAVQEFPLEKTYSEQELEDKIDVIFNTNSFLNEKYDSINITHINNTATFIPNVLFEEENLADYLKFSISLENQSNIAFDSIANIQAKVVFLPFTRINNYIFDKLGSFNFTHHSNKLLKYFLTKNPQNSFKNTYLFFRKDTFDCFILQNNKLLFYNNFTFQNEADVLYFLLFTFEQFALKQDANSLFISGDLKSSDIIYTNLKKYFKQLEHLETEHQTTDLNIQKLVKKLIPIL
jgi:hypothetical protein